MKKIFISFLGLGSYNKNSNSFDYIPTTYEFQNKKSKKTKFIQIAILELLNVKFDKIIIIATNKSQKLHFENLQNELEYLGYNKQNIYLIMIGQREELVNVNTHRQWLEKLLSVIEDKSSLTVDMTHGYRIIPIILATGIHFLKIVRHVHIENILYGAFDLVDRNIEPKPIIEMKTFFAITDWAVAVDNFINHLDLKRVIELSEHQKDFNLYSIDDKIIFEEVNLRIKSSDMIELPEKICKLIEETQKIKSANDSIITRILSEMIINKYKNLSMESMLAYDRKFFEFQLNFIKILIEHNLLMQAYTIMRETIGSIGLIKTKDVKNIKNNIGRKKRKYAEIFINMVVYEENKWQFSENAQKQVDKLKPFYDELKEHGILSKLKQVIKEIVEIRNGFDHAWTLKKFNVEDIMNKAENHLQKLKEIINLLKKYNFI
jgi:CRISPR-associated Csx2 family protein